MENAIAIMQSPPSLPFAKVIQSFTDVHIAHHQALLGLKEDQERQFQAIVQSQQEDRKLFSAAGWSGRIALEKSNGLRPAP